MDTCDYSAPKATALNGSIEGNETQASQKAPLTVGERLTCLEEALSSLDTLFTGLQDSVIHLEKRITETEGCLSSEGAEPILADISRRLRDIESRFANFEAANIDKQLLTIRQDIMKFKTALAAFSNHIHLPDGRLGMPFTLKGG